MSTSIWNGATGDWSTAGDWSGGVPNSPTADASITAPGAYTVTIGMAEAFSVGSLNLSAAGATLAVNGSLTVGGTFDLAAGTLSLIYSSVIHGGTLTAGGGTLASASGTFDQVHVVGPLALTQRFEWLNVTHGLTLTAQGGGAGAISITGDFGVLEFKGSQTFDNATISFGSWIDGLNGDYVLNTGTLTLGAHATLVSSTAQASATIGGATVVNDGTIEAFAAGGIFKIDPASFVNNASVTSNGGLLWISARTFTNGVNGVIDLEPGNAYIGAKNSTLSNQGLISIGATSFLYMGGLYTIAQLGRIDDKGALVLQGTLVNTGSTVSLGTGVLAGNASITGTILGGVVVAGAHGVQLQQATLDGVTYRGQLHLGSGAYLTVTNGLTVTTANGTGPGEVLIDGSGGALYFSGNQTLDNATVRLRGGQDGAHLSLVVPNNPLSSTTLTLGSHLNLISDTAGVTASLDETFPTRGTGTIVNDGTISALSAKGGFTVSTDGFINNGTVRVANGDTLYLTPNTNFANTGTIAVGAGSSAVLGAYGNVAFSNAGQITVARGGTLGVQGSYTVASLGNIADAGKFIVYGTLDNSGSTLRLGTGPIFGGQATVLGSLGSIQGGTVVLGAGHLLYNYGELANLTFQGTVDLSAANAFLNLGGGVTVTDAAGSGPGLIKVTGAGAALEFYDPQGVNANGIDNVKIVLGNAATAATVEILSYASHAQTLTFGANASIVSTAAGAQAMLTNRFFGPDTIVNDGSIVASARGGLFTVSIPTFTNNGQIRVANGDRFDIQAALNGTGQLAIATGGVVELGQTAAAQTIAFSDASGAAKFDAAASFAGTLSGLRAGDTLDLVKTAATGATVNGADQLVIANAGVTVARLQLAGDYSHTAFTVGSDGAGGSLITLSPAAASSAPAVHAMVQAMGGIAGHAGPIVEAHLHAAWAPPAALALGRPSA